MLPKQHRLRHRSDVQRVRRSGRRFKHSLAIFLVTPSSQGGQQFVENGVMIDCPPSRFAFVASRRVGSAVKRNRAKRMMREALRLQMENVQPGWDGIFIAREATATSSLTEATNAIRDLLIWAKILRLNQDHE